MFLCLAVLVPPPGFTVGQPKARYASKAKRERDARRFEVHRRGTDETLCTDPSQDRRESMLPPWARNVCHVVAGLVDICREQLLLLSSPLMSSQWRQQLRRRRDVFPLPACNMELVRQVLPPLDEQWLCLVVKLTNAGLRGLTLLYGFDIDCVAESISRAQRSILSLSIRKVHRFMLRLKRCDGSLSGAGALQKLIGQQGSGIVPLVAHKCDVHRTAGKVDPTPILPERMREIISDPTKMFPDPPAALTRFPNIWGSQRKEFLKFVLLELAAGKVVLATAIRGGGTVFGRMKPTGNIRPIWHGAAVSMAAAPPPKPRHLASPSALLHLEALPGLPYYVSKRDGLNMFDQLSCPACLRPFFAQPWVYAKELANAGDWDLEDLEHFSVGDAPLTMDTRVWPVSTVWGAGFAWSSTICQEQTLHSCSGAGLTDDYVLSDDRPPPRDLTNVHAVATDDVAIFCRGSQQTSVTRAQALDASFQDNGVELNQTKSVDGALDATVIGIDIEAGRYLAANAGKLGTYLLAGCELLQERRASPDQLAALLGHPHWHYQLNRPLYSALHHVYAFTKLEDGQKCRILPGRVIGELVLSLILAPWMEADMQRPWGEHLLAADASPSFGVGVARASCTQAQAREVGQLAASNDLFVRPSYEAADYDVERPRLGVCCRLPVKKSAFKTVISARAKYAAHSGSLEAVGVSTLCRWLTRSERHHARRHAILLDAKAVLGATSKGRTSAPTLRREIAKASACTLACDMLLRCVYIPSESNPSDRASRGLKGCIRYRHRHRANIEAPRSSKLVDYVENLTKAYDHLRKCGMISSSSGSDI